ncbi:MAG TPA: sugar transferase [Abditibacteriaceae bacterium]|jgi:exopolysaccharide biosynthesis polyprenyl glycosylphosphotransferase
MLKSQRAFYLALTLALDVIALFLAFLAAWAMRDSLGNFLVWAGNTFQYPVKEMVRRSNDLSPTYKILLSQNPLVGFKNHLWIFYLMAPAWIFFLNAQNGYDAQARRPSRAEFANCAYAGLLGTAAFLVLIFLVKFGVSRLLILNFLLFGVASLWMARTIFLPVVLRRGRHPIRNMLLIGSAPAAAHFSEFLKSPAYRWSRLLGYVSNDDAAPNTAAEAAAETGVKRLGNLSDLVSLLDREVVDEVVIVRSSGEATGTQAWGDILELCLQRGRTVSMVDDIVPPVGAKVEATMMGSLPTLVMHNTPQNTLGLALKSLMDRTVALLAIIVLSPILIGIAIAIKISSPGPVLFKQKRVGLNGRLFSFYKFRSMVINAEEILEKNRAEWEKHNKMSGGFWKWEEDPRITKIGRILRKYSLDELPQFWNVLRGDMSLVGPRPPLPKEVEQLQPWQRRKLSVKGGLTCLWQVSGRNDIDTDEWMRLDLEYIDNWSLWLDVKLLFQTVKVLVKPKGAS